MDDSAGIHVLLRPAIEGDARAVIDWFATHAEAVLWGGPAVPADFDATWLAREIIATSDTYRTAYAPDKAVIGICGLRPFVKEQRAHIIRLGVAPSLRSRGVGRLLITDAITVAGAQGARTVSLNVYGSNVRARRLYKELGFHASKMRDAPEDSSGVSIYMDRPIPP